MSEVWGKEDKVIKNLKKEKKKEKKRKEMSEVRKQEHKLENGQVSTGG